MTDQDTDQVTVQVEQLVAILSGEMRRTHRFQSPEFLFSANDSLVADAGERYDYVLANPPFGKKSSMSFTNEEGEQKKDELTYRDKTSLDIFWLKDKSLTDLDNLPEPDMLAAEIIENLEAGLSSFREVLGVLEGSPDR